MSILIYSFHTFRWLCTWPRLAVSDIMRSGGLHQPPNWVWCEKDLHVSTRPGIVYSLFWRAPPHWQSPIGCAVHSTELYYYPLFPFYVFSLYGGSCIYSFLLLFVCFNPSFIRYFASHSHSFFCVSVCFLSLLFVDHLSQVACINALSLL